MSARTKISEYVLEFGHIVCSDVHVQHSHIGRSEIIFRIMVKGVFAVCTYNAKMLNVSVRVNYDQNISNQMLAEINYSNAIFRLLVRYCG